MSNKKFTLPDKLLKDAVFRGNERYRSSLPAEYSTPKAEKSYTQ